MPAVEQRLFNIEQQIINLFGMSKPQAPLDEKNKEKDAVIAN